jgi:hypothetical protein
MENLTLINKEFLKSPVKRAAIARAVLGALGEQPFHLEDEIEIFTYIVVASELGGEEMATLFREANVIESVDSIIEPLIKREILDNEQYSTIYAKLLSDIKLAALKKEAGYNSVSRVLDELIGDFKNFDLEGLTNLLGENKDLVKKIANEEDLGELIQNMLKG